MTDFVVNDKNLVFGGVFGNRAENGSVFYNEICRGCDGYFDPFGCGNAVTVIFDREFNRPRIARLEKRLRPADKRQAEDKSRRMQKSFNNKFLAKNSAKEIISFCRARRASGAGAGENISGWQFI